MKLFIIIIFFILFVIMVVSFFRWKRMEFYTMKRENVNTPIDIVITWVNGNENNFMKEVNSYGKKYQLDRFYQNEELKYCLRSIELNMTYVRKIFIVTREDQHPYFLIATIP